VVLHLYTVIFQAEDGFPFFLAGLLLWLCAPYGVALGLLFFGKKPVFAVGYAAASLGFDIFVFVSVFVRPASSTSALGLIAMPFWNLVLFGPAGAFMAWLVIRVLSRKYQAMKELW